MEHLRCNACSEPIMFPTNRERVGHVPVYRQQLVPSTAVLYRTCNSFYVNTDNVQSKMEVTYLVFLRLIHYWHTHTFYLLSFYHFFYLIHFTLPYRLHLLKLGNACYHSVQNLLSSSLLSKNVKIKIY